jgi:hypothetical protein
MPNPDRRWLYRPVLIIVLFSIFFLCFIYFFSFFFSMFLSLCFSLFFFVCCHFVFCQFVLLSFLPLRFPCLLSICYCLLSSVFPGFYLAVFVFGSRALRLQATHTRSGVVPHSNIPHIVRTLFLDGFEPLLPALPSSTRLEINPVSVGPGKDKEYDEDNNKTKASSVQGNDGGFVPR